MPRASTPGLIDAGRARLSIDPRARAAPGTARRGWLLAGPLAMPVALGRGGIRPTSAKAMARTPRGRFRPCGCGGGPTAMPRPRTRAAGAADRAATTPGARIPRDRRYNRPFRCSANEPGDRLWRDDHLYDLIIEIDHNTRPRVAGRGSAVFILIWRGQTAAPTAGCVALDGRRRPTGMACLSELWTKTLTESVYSLLGTAGMHLAARPENRACRPAHGSRRTRSRSRNPRSSPSTAAPARCAARSWR